MRVEACTQRPASGSLCSHDADPNSTLAPHLVATPTVRHQECAWDEDELESAMRLVGRSTPRSGSEFAEDLGWRDRRRIRPRGAWARGLAGGRCSAHRGTLVKSGPLPVRLGTGIASRRVMCAAAGPRLIGIRQAA